MQDKVLLDANIIIRFFEGSQATDYPKALQIIEDINQGKIKALLLDLIIAEIVYVTKRIYKRTKKEISEVLSEFILMENLYVENQAISLEAVRLYADKNIDFADAILCAKQNLEGYRLVSFDRDLKRC
ncbi:MAG: PIN domain-containing protein [Sulfurovum sp.]|nr:PIN domain-containing protein [Sulfurovum sp.]